MAELCPRDHDLLFYRNRALGCWAGIRGRRLACALLDRAFGDESRLMWFLAQVAAPLSAKDASIWADWKTWLGLAVMLIFSAAQFFGRVFQARLEKYFNAKDQAKDKEQREIDALKEQIKDLQAALVESNAAAARERIEALEALLVDERRNTAYYREQLQDLLTNKGARRRVAARELMQSRPVIDAATLEEISAEDSHD